LRFPDFRHILDFGNGDPVEVPMREFSATELGNKTGDVLAAAAQAPVGIVKHGKMRFVVLSSERFAHMQDRADPRIARRTADIPQAEGDALMAELTRIVESDD